MTSKGAKKPRSPKSKPRRALDRRGTAERRLGGPAKRGFLGLTEIEFKKKIQSLGLNPSLPFLVVSAHGVLEYLNPRMFFLLGLPKDLELPCQPEKWDSFWQFANEEKSPVRLLQDSLLSTFTESKTHSVLADFKLKSYKLLFKPLSEILGEKGSDKIVVFAQLLRSGDLLVDKNSRQSMFRAVAHEIRTSVMALEGMIQIASQSQNPATAIDRMKASVARLEKVVERLAEFRAGLGITDEDLAKGSVDLVGDSQGRGGQKKK